jgi:hypothetical protein
VLLTLLARADRGFAALHESGFGPERHCAAHGDTAAFWGRADMPALGFVWSF